MRIPSVPAQSPPPSQRHADPGVAHGSRDLDASLLMMPLVGFVELRERISLRIVPTCAHFAVGSLTYDNEHFVNDNPASPKSGQPKRFALWEIHPITAFYVCPAGDGCDPNAGQWVTLTDWAKAHP